MSEVELLKDGTNAEEEQALEMEEWSDDEHQSQTKIESDFSAHKLRATYDTDDVTEIFDENIFHAKDETEMDHLQQEEENDANLYDPVELTSVNVPFQIRELFHFITKYRPQILEMETKLKPFLPDFIPAVGDPDAFMKIDRPDEKVEFLGLTVIDEPSLSQSDPSVLDLRLRSIYKQSSAKTAIARTVEEGNKTKAIDKWIKDINELHRLKPLPTVTYFKPLPDIDALLQEWNSDIEEILCDDKFLQSDIHCDLLCYIDIACGFLDIPIYPGYRVHSLHLLLTLYSEMGRLQK
ncbi:intraflagellar transport protein 46 homolog isoform X2 [Daphnia pulex]|uniref:intraflagellar transport protein 46 homolog isoform X2 n=1 Tax=Daphnia pulex TaxID=6669 RepID=UPI001EDF6BFE|nr:intraflagellar transport protein 46 homolog isoform X2 [Daphnia pulex]XP_046648018.1 intraflagellar transport protein 46 homolog isoform X2 [Daphnia pulicaria]